MYLTIAVVVLALFSIFLGLFALARNTQSPINRAFALFAEVTAVWMVANYVGSAFKYIPWARYFIQTDFLLGPLVAFSVWQFGRELLSEATPERRPGSGRIKLAFLVVALGASLSSLFPIVAHIGINEQHMLVITYGDLYSFYTVALLGEAVIGLFIIFRALLKATGKLKNQIQSMVFGLVLFVLLVAIPNLIMPIFTNSDYLLFIAGNFAYLGIVAFTFVTFYSIVRHRLFDIRLAVVRTIGFITTVGLVSGVYSLLLIGIGGLLITDGRFTSVQNSASLLLLIPPTIFIALTFHAIQTFIARITRRIFYQGLFDLRSVLDELSDTLVASNEINEIMKGSLGVIDTAIQPSESYFVVFDDKGAVHHKIAHRMKAPESVAELIGDIKNIKSNPVVRDELSEAVVPRSFVRNDVSLALRLGSRDKPAGILLVGTKQNGRTYNQQDIDLLRIGAKNLTIALENAKKYEQISHFADTMHKEVIKATAKLRAANEELKTLDIMKDDFISMASHQLRTPASSVHEALQMLNHPGMTLTKSERQRLEELAEASSEHLVAVVTDMLSISRIQAGHFTINKSPVVMQELVERVLKQTAVLAEQKGIKITFEKPAEGIQAVVDMSKMNEAVSNYIENAIKYSPEKTTITVSLRAEGEKVIFEVSDQGMGVPEAERKNLFGKFYRAGNARKEQPDGNGIGLFVVKSIAEGHGGDAYYKPLERGSTFGFSIERSSK